jgi:predicted enzyme related to lactoylglutathione lyase
MQRAGGLDVTPTLPVSNMDEATRFYEAAGFDVRRYDDGFAFVTFEDQSVFDLDLHEHARPPTNGAGCYIITNDVDAWHRRFSAAGLDVTEVEDMPWGMHEFTLTDPSGNHVRVGLSIEQG